MISSRMIERNPDTGATVHKKVYIKKKRTFYVVEAPNCKGPQDRQSFPTLAQAREAAGIGYCPPSKETPPKNSYPQFTGSSRTGKKGK